MPMTIHTKYRHFYFDLSRTSDPEKAGIMIDPAFLKSIGWQQHWPKYGTVTCNCPCCQKGIKIKGQNVWHTADSVCAEALVQAGIKACVETQLEISRAADRYAVSLSTGGFPLSVPFPAGLQLRSFQCAAVRYALACFERDNGCLLADEMGLGKTPTAIAIALAGGLEKVLVVCPASLRLNWQREIEKWAEVTPTQLKTSKDVENCSTWAITNPERVIAKGDKETGDGLFSRLMQTSWDLLILDEAHVFQNPKSSITKRVLGVRAKPGAGAVPGLRSICRHVLALTGTPISNRTIEAFPLLNVLDRSFSRSGYFCERYCGPKTIETYVRGGGKEKKKIRTFTGGSNLAELNLRLRRNVMVRRAKEAVLPQLPAKVTQIIPLQGEELEAIAERENQLWLDLSPTALEVLLSNAGWQSFQEAADVLCFEAQTHVAVSELMKIRQQLGLAKVPAAVELVNTILLEKQKVVVMAYHRAVVDALHQQLGGVKLYGGMSAEAKQEAIDAFQEGQERVFIGGIKAAGVGITLCAADTMIFVEHDWVPSVVAQAEARIHRIGQANSVQIIHLVVDGTVDSLIVKSIVRKQTLISAALDPTARKSYPQASEQDIEQMPSLVAAILGERSIPDTTRKLLTSVQTRLRTRRATDGEVWVLRKIESEMKK